MTDLDSETAMTPTQRTVRMRALNARSAAWRIGREVESFREELDRTCIPIDSDRHRDVVGALQACRELLYAIADTLGAEAQA